MGMVERYGDLNERWGPTIRNKELQPMVERGTLFPITTDRAAAIGVTPHVTNLRVKSSTDEDKARIAFDKEYSRTERYYILLRRMNA
jgi:hypothetical protein